MPFRWTYTKSLCTDDIMTKITTVKSHGLLGCLRVKVLNNFQIIFSKNRIYDTQSLWKMTKDSVGLTNVGAIRHGNICYHDDVMKCNHFPRNWPFVRGIHRSPMNSPHKGQWRRALMFSLIYVWINDWVSNREAGDSWRNRAHYDVIVMIDLI